MATRKRVAETCVGLLIIVGFVALAFLAFKVSGLTWQPMGQTYTIKANFDNIGDLKERAPVSVAGVKVGTVTNIALNSKTYEAVVTMTINKDEQIPVDSTANIYTQGLLGSNYVSITPGFTDNFLSNGDTLERTNSAMILQNIIGQLMYSFKNQGSSNKGSGSGSNSGNQ